VPTDFDIYNTRSWVKNALLQPEPRALYQRLLAQGWTDAIKATHPDQPVYTFWDYLRQAWERNAGMRLDHILLSASLAGGLRETGVDAWVRGLPGASDHAPAWANIQTNPSARSDRPSDAERGQTQRQHPEARPDRPRR
jgi:exodeoxyribonuclease III